MPTQIEDHCVRPPGREGSWFRLVFSFIHSFQIREVFLFLFGDGRGQCLASVSWAGQTERRNDCPEPVQYWESPVLLPAQLHVPAEIGGGFSAEAQAYLQGLIQVLNLGTTDIVGSIICCRGLSCALL